MGEVAGGKISHPKFNGENIHARQFVKLEENSGPHARNAISSVDALHKSGDAENISLTEKATRSAISLSSAVVIEKQELGIKHK